MTEPLGAGSTRNPGNGGSAAVRDRAARKAIASFIPTSFSVSSRLTCALHSMRWQRLVCGSSPLLRSCRISVRLPCIPSLPYGLCFFLCRSSCSFFSPYYVLRFVDCGWRDLFHHPPVGQPILATAGF